MRIVTGSRLALLAILAALSLALVVAAAASGSSGPRPGPGAVRVAPGRGVPGRAALGQVASLAPRGAAGSLTAAQVQQAARTCAVHAAAAGWANNGSYGGNLVTAVAVCIAESGGQPAVYLCESTGKDGYYPPVDCPGGSYDRGLWQLNSKYQANVPDSCAFQAQCNADAAYRISAAGTSFAPWAVYGSDTYARYLADAQAAVTGLASGTVASALFGVCLAPSSPATGAAVVAARCGRQFTAQQWTRVGSTLRHGGLCLTAPGAGGPSVSLSTCTGAANQGWLPHGLDQLQNSQNGGCLDDPATSATPGTALSLAACAAVAGQTWWLP